MDQIHDTIPTFKYCEDDTEFDEDEDNSPTTIQKYRIDTSKNDSKQNPLLVDKGSPTLLSKHRKELNEMFNFLQHTKEIIQKEQVNEISTKDDNNSVTNQVQGEFNFNNDSQALFDSIILQNKSNSILRKATKMKQFKEVQLEFVNDNIEDIQLKSIQNFIPDQMNQTIRKNDGLLNVENQVRLHECEQIDNDESQRENQLGAKDFKRQLSIGKMNLPQRVFTNDPQLTKADVLQEVKSTKNIRVKSSLRPKESSITLKRTKSKSKKRGNSQNKKSRIPKFNTSDKNLTKFQEPQSPLVDRSQVNKKTSLNNISPFSLQLIKINSEQVPQSKSKLLLNDENSLQKQHKSIFSRLKNTRPYNEILLSDLKFKDFYAESLYQAIFTFPKFQRTFSKNYKNVQWSFRKVSKKKKTIVFDIDETLVLATTNKNDLKEVDEQIFMKRTRFGGQAKAFLSFRPYLHDMLDELSKDFELILYTCGTASYAQCFADAVQKKRKYFNHVLCLSHCLYSIENDMFIKDLKILEEGRSLSDIVIVDNNIQSFFLQLSNGIPIYDYTGDKNDQVLLSLTEYLKSFRDVNDVRQKIDNDFKIKELLEEKADLYMNYQ